MIRIPDDVLRDLKRPLVQYDILWPGGSLRPDGRPSQQHMQQFPRERKFHGWNFRTLELSLSITFVPRSENVTELLLPRAKMLLQ